MIKTVICTECGKKFKIEDDEGVFTPPSCPQCNKTIVSIQTTPTSEEMAAFVSEE